ncbi:MAG TPA: inositol monophosphatase family protein [Vicinamibacterales bacterium]|nr:inositol monophosphatase family protein [Vicinamibacterales bacterium]
MLPDPVLLATAIEIVTRAGAIQDAHFGRLERIEKKGNIDLVTEVDLEIERMFRALIAERFPEHRILAEEFGAGTEGSASSPYCWIFDPVDGTTNYAHGMPIFCSSLALEIDGRIEVAAVYDPTRRELFTAERGGGARLNGAPMRVSGAERLIDSMLCTGFPYNVHEIVDELVGLFASFVGRARAVRRLGSAAIDLCYVAAGRLDGFWERLLSPWDIAAGALLVEEAGGQVSGLDGGPFNVRAGEVVASNGRIHGDLLATIAEYRSRKRTE